MPLDAYVGYGHKLVAQTTRRGVRLQVRYSSGWSFPRDAMDLTWEEWRVLATWVEHEFAKQEAEG